VIALATGPRSCGKALSADDGKRGWNRPQAL